MFQLIEREFSDLMFQIGTSSWGGTRKMPFAFTEQGVAMLRDPGLVRKFSILRSQFVTSSVILL
jgi:hypothetical protein